jgi:hypothetical protein
MRNQPPFACSRCGDSAVDVERCVRCDVEVVDRSGQARLAPGVSFVHYRNFYGYLFPGATFTIIGWYFFSLAMTFSGASMSTTVPVLAVALFALFGLYVVNTVRRGKKHRQPLRQAMDRVAATPVTPIASSSGRAHVRGRVRMLEPVRAPSGETAAAYLLRVSEGLSGRRRAIVGHAVREASGSGTFLVEDDTGAALVDDDAFAVFPLDAAGLDWNSPLRLLVQDGDEVEIVGPAARRSSSDCPALAKGKTASDATSILVFDGTPAERVLILAARSRVAR